MRAINNASGGDIVLCVIKISVERQEIQTGQRKQYGTKLFVRLAKGNRKTKYTTTTGKSIPVSSANYHCYRGLQITISFCFDNLPRFPLTFKDLQHFTSCNNIVYTKISLFPNDSNLSWVILIIAIIRVTIFNIKICFNKV